MAINFFEGEKAEKIATSLETIADHLENLGSPEAIAEDVAAWMDEHITENPTVVIDDSLSIRGAAADAKKTGDEISDLKNVIDWKASAICTDSDESSMHDMLSTVMLKAIKFKNGTNSFGKFLYADKLHSPYNKSEASYTVDGIPVSLSNNCITLNGTCSGTYKTHFYGKQDASALTGNYKLFVIISTEIKMRVKFREYVNGTAIDYNVNTTGAEQGTYSDVIDMTDATQYEIAIETRADTGTYLNAKIWFGLFPSDVVIVNTNENTGADYNLPLSTALRFIDTIHSTSIINYIADTKEYIDNAVPDGMVTEELLTYLSPEMENYGAKGDGETDDTAALQNCIDDAILKALPVRAYGKYKTTSPIKIVADGTDIYINKIIYTGSDAGMILTGNRNILRMNYLKADGGTGDGLRIITASDTNCSYNDISINRISAKENAMEIINTYSARSIYYNYITTRYLYSNSANAIYTNILNDNENTFYGKQVICTNGWFLYQSQGGRRSNKFYYFGLEESVKNGIYGNGIFCHLRTVELTNHYTDSSVERGILLRAPFFGLDSQFIDTDVPFESIDMSECYSADEMIAYVGNNTGDYDTRSVAYWYLCKQYHRSNAFLSKCINLGEHNVIPAQQIINCLDGDILSYFDKKIYRPKDIWYRLITESSYTPYSTDSMFPTVFDLDTNATIYLNDSYCCIGINDVEIRQYDGKKAHVYNKDNTLIFNGTNYPAGIYHLKSHITDKTITITDGNGSTTLTDRGVFYGDNEVWTIHAESIPQPIS